MNMPLAAQQSANINRPSARKRLSNKIVPFNLDLGTDNTNALRRMLEQALVTARNAERYAAKQQAEIDRLRTLSITDENTGLLNRRGFVEALDRAVARGQRYEEPAVLLLIDLDGFKATNDTFGHPAGDLVLTAVANVLTKITRKVDDVARLGGDEFAVILNKLPESLAQKTGCDDRGTTQCSHRTVAGQLNLRSGQRREALFRWWRHAGRANDL